MTLFQKSRLRVALDIISMAVLLHSSAWAQPSRPPEFEVATIKPAAPDRFPTEVMDTLLAEVRFGEGAGSRANSGLFEASGVTLRMLVAHAYGVPLSRVIGPGWTNSLRYDIVAKIPGQPGVETFRKMQQQLLSERFRLILHPEQRTMAVYRLTVAKNGHRLSPPITERRYDTVEDLRTAAAASTPLIPGATKRMSHGNASLDEIAARLAVLTDLPVKNATGLSGQFSFSLDWSNKDPNGFRDAIEDQLGLILKRSNESLDVLVIGQAQKTPTEN